ncbi:unnamed protein product [Bursaphelenchus okinawaensis]|uniref:Uncharacterized protein n=1 Tax=Bursaphelenchus okinawaensis TaxID=465554 RepID=A0A811KP58_9BILA|nr:unnamed protein product [Bursaphelenchus okinawaensis]CAG9107455.1 unnamed protein product [Bursaphelenchus okinawaensis]
MEPPRTVEEATTIEVELLRVLGQKIAAFLEIRRQSCQEDAGFNDAYGTVFANVRKVVAIHKIRKNLQKKIPTDRNVKPQSHSERNRVANNKSGAKSSKPPRKVSPNIVNTNIRSQPSASLNNEAPVTNGPSDIVPVVLNQSFKGKYELGQRGRKLVKINGLAFYKHSNNVYKCRNYYNMVPRCRAKANVTELNGLTFLFTLLENHTCSQ